MQSRKRVMVLFGGRSGEHEVSINSAASVIAALDREKYEVIPVAVTREGKWLSGVAPEQLLAGTGVPVPLVGEDIAEPGSAPVDAVGLALAAVGKAGPGGAGHPPGGWAGVPATAGHSGSANVDVVIPVLHGTYGEDGTVQGLLELADVAFVGAGVLGSALGMDKILMKTVLAQHGIPQARFLSFLRRDWEHNSPQVTGTVESGLGYPCFVKPANLGSSVGISKARHREEFIRAMDLACRYDRKIIVEEFIDGREVEVGVLGNGDPEASLPGEVVPLREFYDYEAKYSDGLARLEIPAQLPPDVTARLRELAVQVFRILDCAGLARVDFFLRSGYPPEGGIGEVLVNEINTMPGFTRLSMFPKLWEATGVGYQALLDRLIDLAVERHRDKNRSQTTFQQPTQPV